MHEITRHKGTTPGNDLVTIQRTGTVEAGPRGTGYWIDVIDGLGGWQRKSYLVITDEPLRGTLPVGTTPEALLALCADYYERHGRPNTADAIGELLAEMVLERAEKMDVTPAAGVTIEGRGE